jgi:hypothetical protein
MMALNSSKIPPTAIPKSRKGRSSSQTKGYAISARRAKGQHSTSKMSQSKKLVNVRLFIYSLSLHIIERNYYIKGSCFATIKFFVEDSRVIHTFKCINFLPKNTRKTAIKICLLNSYPIVYNFIANNSFCEYFLFFVFIGGYNEKI